MKKNSVIAAQSAHIQAAARSALLQNRKNAKLYAFLDKHVSEIHALKMEKGEYEFSIEVDKNGKVKIIFPSDPLIGHKG